MLQVRLGSHSKLPITQKNVKFVLQIVKMKYLQKIIELGPYPRGCHLVTNQV